MGIIVHGEIENDTFSVLIANPFFYVFSLFIITNSNKAQVLRELFRRNLLRIWIKAIQYESSVQLIQLF